MTLHFAKPGKCYDQTTLASVMLLFFIHSCNTDGLQINFSSRVLQPNNQVIRIIRIILQITTIIAPIYGCEVLS